MKVAFVVQRYGEEISGGAELHCRLIAERMASLGHEVHTYTTCARDYMTWKDEYEPGTQELNGVTVHRFRVDEERDVEHFNSLSEEVYSKASGAEKEEEWMRAQGPYSSELFKALKKEKDQYDRVLFYNYLYCTTYYGLPLCEGRAILAPMAHDELPIYLSIFQKIFTGCEGIMFNTEEERDFIQTQFPVSDIPSRVVGMWAPEPLDIETDDDFYERAGSRNFIVYVGRIDRSKGCEDLVNTFIQYKKTHPSDMKLLLMGKGDMKIPNHKDVVAWGYASDEEKWQALQSAVASVIPSLYESLSMSLLESFVVGRPVLVNAECQVTKAHCVKSNGGLWYRTREEFAEMLGYLQKHPEKASKMGKNGRQYVDLNYSWGVVIDKYSSIFEELASKKG